jgi:hypothetical protein
MTTVGDHAIEHSSTLGTNPDAMFRRITCFFGISGFTRSCCGSQAPGLIIRRHKEMAFAGLGFVEEFLAPANLVREIQGRRQSMPEQIAPAQAFHA